MCVLKYVAMFATDHKNISGYRHALFKIAIFVQFNHAVRVKDMANPGH